MINIRKIAGLGLAGMIAFSSVVSVFAANQTNNSQSSSDKDNFRRGGFEQISEKYKSALDNLVTAGTITQEQADAVESKLPGGGNKDGKGPHGDQGQKQSPFDTLVTAGTITQEQADAIESAMKTARESKDSTKSSMKDILASLVTAGTLSQEQADAVTAAMPGKGNKDGKGHQEPQGQKQSPFDSLVTAGTITQEQADAIESAMKTSRDSKDSTKSSMKDILDSLVTAGTLSQEQENAVTAAMPSKDNKKGFRAPDQMLESQISSLVTDGTITQDQESAIVSALKAVSQSNNK